MLIIPENAKVLGQGITGSEGSRALTWMLEYGTNVVAGVTPGKGGQEVQGVPIFNTVQEAIDAVGPIDISVSFAPPLRARAAAEEAINAKIGLNVILAEKIPTKDAAFIYELAKQNGVHVIGPNTAGLINPTKKLKIGLTGGGNPSKVFVPGNIAVVSKSGSMAAEISLLLKNSGLGVSWATGIGGDRIIGTTFADYLEALEPDPQTQASVIFGELGGTYEEQLAEAIKQGRIKKPVVAFIVGEFTMMLPSDVQFGHAGAIIEGERGKPSHKREVLKAAGAQVAESLDDIPELLKKVLP